MSKVDENRSRFVSAWKSPLARRARDVGFWVIFAIILFVLYRRIAPAVEFEDFGPAPAIEMATLEGETFRLSSLRGQVAVVNVWATWCPPCRVEMPGFVKLQEEFAGEVQFVGLSTDDSIEPVREFVERTGINFPILVGPNLAGSAYHVPVLPTTFLIDRNGHIRFVHEGLFLAHSLRPALRSLVAESGTDL